MRKKDASAGLKTSFRKWTAEILEPHLKASPERREVFDTDVGLDIKGLYTPVDLSRMQFDYEQDLGFPGQYPFTRGIDPSMYRSRPWIMRAYAGFGEVCPKVHVPNEPVIC